MFVSVFSPPVQNGKSRIAPKNMGVDGGSAVAAIFVLIADQITSSRIRIIAVESSQWSQITHICPSVRHSWSFARKQRKPGLELECSRMKIDFILHDTIGLFSRNESPELNTLQTALID